MLPIAIERFQISIGFNTNERKLEYPAKVKRAKMKLKVANLLFYLTTLVWFFASAISRRIQYRTSIVFVYLAQSILFMVSIVKIKNTFQENAATS